MKKTKFIDLVGRYLRGRASKNEQKLLLHYYSELQKKEQEWDDRAMGKQDDTGEMILTRVFEDIDLHESKLKKNKPLWLIAAASVIISISIGAYFFLDHNPYKKVAEQAQSIIEPGGNKAVLILADGTKVSLTDAATGKIADQAGIRITKTADGQLIYTVASSTDNKGKPSYNTVQTPYGGQYQINLPDGTKVWLNAASSLKYPTAFVENERKVELSGEAYFEVTKDKTKPFKVITDKQEVQVLGTHFNVNAYPDEDAAKTSLLEGAVKVSRIQNGTKAGTTYVPTASKLLTPGQQSTLNAQRFDVNQVDVEDVVAWKNGSFVFNNEDIKSAMRKLARWYNIEVSYSGNFDNIYFGGSFSRSNNLAETLKILESTNEFKFKIEGRRINIIR